MFLAFRRLLLVCLTWSLPALAVGQGILVDVEPGHRFRLPRPHIWNRPVPEPQPQSYRIKEIAVGVNLSDQVARVRVSQSFVNTGSQQMEVCFVFPLPYDGAIDQMTLMVDGKEFEARLLGADEARRIYEGYMRRNRDPALIEWMGMGMFKTSVFPVPPGAERTVTLQYSQVCRKAGGLTEFLFPLSTARYTSHPPEKVTIDVAIQSRAPIQNIYSPTHEVSIATSSPYASRLSYTSESRIPIDDFRLLYDVGTGPVGASVLSYRPEAGEDGYFLMLVSPEIEREIDEPPPKTVVFVVDRSGSMSGKKIEQAREALRFVLNNLNEGDLFNIVAYDSSVESFRPELQRYNDETRAQALGFVEGLYAGGSTNIDSALEVALNQLQDDERPTYVVFLTDGLPTAGEKNEMRIVQNARTRNDVRARIFTLGVGYDVNSRLLDKIARECFGQSEYVRPNEDLEVYVSSLYRRIGAPALTDVQIQFDMEGFPAERGSPANRVYPRDAYDLFAGDQLVLVGRYKAEGTAKVTITGKLGGETRTFDFPAEFVAHSPDDSFAFVEKLWAVRRIGEIIDEIDLNGHNDELVTELVHLATQHGILTPYTTFLADEFSTIRDVASREQEVTRLLLALEQTSGADAFYQRALKGELQRFELATPESLGRLAEAEQAYRLGNDSSARSGFGGRGRGAGSFGGGGGLGLDAPATATRRGFGDTGGEPADGDGASEGAAPLQRVGRKTFYRRNDRWEDSALTEELEAEAREIVRFSDEYFGLLEEHGSSIRRYLAMEGTVLFVVDDRAYLLKDE